MRGLADGHPRQPRSPPGPPRAADRAGDDRTATRCCSAAVDRGEIAAGQPRARLRPAHARRRLRRPAADRGPARRPRPSSPPTSTPWSSPPSASDPDPPRLPSPSPAPVPWRAALVAGPMAHALSPSRPSPDREYRPRGHVPLQTRPVRLPATPLRRPAYGWRCWRSPASAPPPRPPPARRPSRSPAPRPRRPSTCWRSASPAPAPTAPPPGSSSRRPTGEKMTDPANKAAVDEDRRRSSSRRLRRSPPSPTRSPAKAVSKDGTHRLRLGHLQGHRAWS